jgi:lipopolysaccharide/colanic/teichoic acid biosynthesis glycosyltransferase
MFRLEKVFQNNDTAYNLFIVIIKTIVIFFSYYLFSILEENSIYELLNYEIFERSRFFYYSIILCFSFFIINIFNKEKQIYKRNFISFMREDLLNFLISNIFIFLLFYSFQINFSLDIQFLYSLVFSILILSLLKLFFNFLYDYLVEENIIQKNIMIVGDYENVKELLKYKFDNIYVFKCCIILDVKNYNLSLIKSELKIPIFSNHDDMRSILEYHALGQVWLLDDKKNKLEESLIKILKFSVDILIVKLDERFDLKGTKLLANRFAYEFYEVSRFHGISLFFKIIIDKIFSIIFLLLSSPILIISAMLIYIEDGYPIIFTQNRTGWDGRRFKIYKLRTLKKENFDKTIQVTKNDKRVLKCGTFIRRYSIDELPQFINVFIGDMSIVGPRPHMVQHDIQYAKLFNNFLKRHKCNPGLTGWAQVNGLRGATPNPETMSR